MLIYGTLYNNNAAGQPVNLSIYNRVEVHSVYFITSVILSTHIVNQVHCNNRGVSFFTLEGN